MVGFLVAKEGRSEVQRRRKQLAIAYPYSAHQLRPLHQPRKSTHHKQLASNVTKPDLCKLVQNE